MRERLWHALDLGRVVGLVAADLAARAVSARTPGAQDDVAVVRLDELDDFVLWLDSARQLRDYYAGRRIVLIGNAAWTDLARALPMFDEVIAVDVPRFDTELRYRFQTVQALLAREFDVLVNPAYTRSVLSGAEAIGRVMRARQKVGSAGDRADGWRARLAGLWDTRRIETADRPLNELERNAEFLRGLTGWPIRPAVYSLATHDLSTPASCPESYYLLFPGAVDPHQQWPAESFAAVARHLARSGMTGLICGEADDSVAAAQIVAMAGVPIEDRCGRTAPCELVGLIARAAVVVTHEASGAAHIAAAVATPSVCIVGGGRYGRHLPYPKQCAGDGATSAVAANPMSCFGCRWNCIYPIGPAEPAPCIASVSVDSVIRLLTFDETPYDQETNDRAAPYGSTVP